MKKVVIILLSILIYSCSREQCWDVYDFQGQQISQVCDKTEKEMQAQYGEFFDLSSAPRFCWYMQRNGQPSYAENVSEKMAGIYFRNATSLQKVACGYCQRWLTREKHLYKPTGSFSYVGLFNKLYCGDTCNTLYSGKTVILRENVDSLITHEFVQRQN